MKEFTTEEGKVIKAHGIEWALTAAKAIQACVSWASADMLVDLLEGGETGIGADDGYNLSASMSERDISGFGWRVDGGCGYGSHIYATAFEVSVATCGGHWARILRHDSGSWVVLIDADTDDSQTSWGDSSQWAVEEGTDLYGHAARIDRVARILRAYNAQF